MRGLARLSKWLDLAHWSFSLLEALVFGGRAAAAMREVTEGKQESPALLESRFVRGSDPFSPSVLSALSAPNECACSISYGFTASGGGPSGPDDPRKIFFPSGNVRSRPFARLDPSFAW